MGLFKKKVKIVQEDVEPTETDVYSDYENQALPSIDSLNNKPTTGYDSVGFGMNTQTNIDNSNVSNNIPTNINVNLGKEKAEIEKEKELLQIELAEVQKEREKKDEEFFEKNAQLQEQQAIAHEKAMIEKAKLELEQEKQNLQSDNYNPYANPTRVYDNISVVKDPRRKASSFALVMAIILIAVSMGYLIYRSGKTNHQIAVNLKSVGLIKYQGTYQLNYFIKSSNNTVTSAFNPKMKVSDPSIAKVNETTGYISAGRNIGHTTLEIMNLNDNRTVVNQMEIYVVSEKVPLEDFDIDNSDITLAQGEQEMITIAPIPEDSTECEYEYESSNENCATVNDAGVITAKKNSCSCKITVINGDIKNRINVTVK